MRLKEYLDDMKPDFHKLYGGKYGFESFQSEAHMDLTMDAAVKYIQKLAMSGKLKEIQNMATQGATAVQDSPYYQELLQAVVQNYYGLDWEYQKKQHLAQDILVFMLDGLKHRFQAGGYSIDQKGVMDFLGIDMGILGKVGGMFGKFFG